MSLLVKARSYSKDGLLPGLDPLLSRIFLARGITDVKSLDKRLSRLLPYQDLKGIEKAVDALEMALQEQKRVVVVGDFDADGATSSALAVKALRSFGLQQVEYLVPNRFEYGYGLTPEIVSVAIERSQAELLITVDNGISSCEGVSLANQHGISDIITDHHLPPDVLPDACAIVNPNQLQDGFLSKKLAGVGVIFYVMLALRARLKQTAWFKERKIDMPNMAHLLDLVALGTIADLVPLDDNNRILVYQGLQRMRQGKCSLGIKILAAVSGLDLEMMTASDLAFKIAPRLNAAGRLQDMSLGIACLLTEDAKKAHALAVELDRLNGERRHIEQGMQKEAMAALKTIHLKKNKSINGLCLFHSDWHQGIIGILAARVKEQVYRPVVVFTQVDETTLKASARSIPGVHIRDVLADIANRHKGLLLKFGGHAMAAGLSILKARYAEFQQAFDEQVAACLSPDMTKQVIYSDGQLTKEQLSLETAKKLDENGPWGQGFPEPLFEGEFVLLEQRLLAQKHLKLLLKLPDQEKTVDAIAFYVDLNVWPNYRCKKVYLVYRMHINHYLGTSRLQLMIEYLRAR